MPDTPEYLSGIITGRKQSFFAEDWSAHKTRLQEAIKGSRCLIPGGAGSIGQSFIKTLIPFSPAEIIVCDPDENALAEYIRDIRNSFPPDVLPVLSNYSIGIGSPLFEQWLSRQSEIDYVFSFAARKHVRAERDVYSALEMFACNVLAHQSLFEQMRIQKPRSVFTVSTDKAADPASLMGASKRLMENLLFANADAYTVQSSRFANVLFSAGSLSASFLQRYRYGHAFACPGDIKRYFISPSEAGQLCLLSAFANDCQGVWIPLLHPDHDQIYFKEVLFRLMQHWNLKSDICSSEAEAINKAALRSGSDSWPVLLTETTTPGEKATEIFTGINETLIEGVYTKSACVLPPEYINTKALSIFTERIRKAMIQAPMHLEEIQEWVKECLPLYQPVEGKDSLDNRM